MPSPARPPLPRYKKPLPPKLPPVKLPIFRHIISHPASEYTVNASKEAAKLGGPVIKRNSLVGPQQVYFSPAPRTNIPLVVSPLNHRMWNPIRLDSKNSRLLEQDESGKLAAFAKRFGGSLGNEDVVTQSNMFDLETDLSFLDGETAQSPDRPASPKDIIGKPKIDKKKKR